MDIHAMILRNRFWLKDILNGSKIYRPFKEVRYVMEHDEAETRALRQTMLEKHLRFAQQNTKFYAGMTSLKLQDYPVMNKMSLIDHMDEIRVDAKNIPGQVGEVHIQRTSGSTGTPFAVPQDTKKRQRRIAELKYFGKVSGFNSHEKLIHLRTWNKWQSKSSKQIKSENIIPFDVTKFGVEEMQSLCELIQSEKALCLRGYVSAFDSVANYIMGCGKVWKFPSLRIIIAGGEALHDDVRQKIKIAFGCDVMSQYADEECGILAQETLRTPPGGADNEMYMNWASYVFEVLKMESDEPAAYGEPGRMVLTDLYNRAFPIVRYDTGDVAVMLPPNEYSHGYPVLGKLMGRRFDLTYATNGQVVHPLTYGRTLKHFDSVVQWQFIQHGEKSYELKVILRDNDVSKISDAVKLFKETLGEDAEIIISQVEELPVLQSGKRKPVVNEWKK